MTAIHSEHKSRLHLGESDGVGGERRDGWRGTGASAQRIQCIAAWKDKNGEQQRAERPQRSVNSFHSASYTGEAGRELTWKT